MNYNAEALAQTARQAGRELAQVSEKIKNDCLLTVATMLTKNYKKIVIENKKDLLSAKKNGLSSAMIDRLKIDKRRLEQMAEGVRQIAALPDPTGQVIKGWTRPNGLKINKVRIPLGVIFMIFESRPNVTIDAAGLALKSGNAVILRGGKEAIYSNIALGKIFTSALKKVGLNVGCVQVVKTPDRNLANELMKQDKYIDVVIPRGGKGLIKAVKENSVIPVISHLDGICHVYIDEYANINMGVDIAINAKTHRTGVCNAMETLLVHKSIAKKFLPIALKAFKDKKTKLLGCKKTLAIANDLKIKIEEATSVDWATEYLENVLSIKVVGNIENAVTHIGIYGSGHTDAIVTDSLASADYFKKGVDSSSVMVNASTRFSDGFEYGFGAEIGISTNKLHARGPVGLEELTTYKFTVEGNGNIRD